MPYGTRYEGPDTASTELQHQLRFPACTVGDLEAY